MQQNQLSRYGAISRIVPDLAPGAKVFLVCDSDDTTVGPMNLGAEFPVDNEGVVRVYTTIQSAVNAASANRGDVVLVLPGYDHTLARADSWATAGVTVLGIGNGSNMPTVRYGAKTDEVGIAANNVTVDGIRFLADADSIARALDLDSGFSGHTVRNCAFDFDSNGQDFRVMMRVASPRTLIESNDFRAEDTAGCGKGISILGGYPDFLKIRNNSFYGQFDTVGDSSDVAGAIAIDVEHDSGDTVLRGLEISENNFVSTDTASALVINLGNGATTVKGIVTKNRIASYDTASNDTDIVSTGGAIFVENWLKSADSDRSEVMISEQAKFPGLQDS
jgi:hypothetical protein